MKLQKWLLGTAFVLLGIGWLVSSGAFGLNWRFIDKYIHVPKSGISVKPQGNSLKIVDEENVVTEVVDKTSPSVVTVGITQTSRIGSLFQTNPFDPFNGMPGQGPQSQKIEQDIGSGFIISADGLVVTNKHVVADTQAKYRVITSDNKTYDVVKIYRDPDNDLAIVKINASGLRPLEMGDSTKIKVGQTAIAIGTALGEFRNTVTVGVISGVGRGITAGGPLDGTSEKLDNVIQTDAAINPGNSGGPLLNSAGQAIGVNSAVASDGQGIGFALPINVVKDAVANFNSTGQFNRPYMGVEYRMITRQMAILNDIPEGAYVANVVSGSPADKGGVQDNDIITKINGQKLTDTNDLAHVISGKKVGDQIVLTIWRDGKEMTKTVSLGSQDQ
jgi:S1-C subfamily serine protease